MKTLFLLLFLVLLVAAGIVLYKNWRKDFIREEIPNFVFLKSDSLYRITFDEVVVDEIEGEVIIRNLQLTPDTTYKKPNDSSLPANLLKVTVPEIHISGVKTEYGLLNKEVIAKKINLTGPVVTMFNNQHKQPKADTTPTTNKIHKVLLRGLEKIKVDTILITNAGYHICLWPKGDTLFKGKQINAQLNHLEISDSTSTDTSRILFAKNAALTVNEIVIGAKSRLYHYRFNDIQLQTAEKLFTVGSFNLVPLLNEAAFMRAAKWQTDRLVFDFNNLRFKQINVQELLNGNLIAGELSISRALFRVFRDKSYPRKKISKVGHYPHQQFLKIPVDVTLKKVVIQGGSIVYKEKNPQTTSSGHVTFNNVSATLYNITNNEAHTRSNPVSTVKFSSRFLNKVPLKATLRFYLNSPQGKFTVSGTMGATDATIFNQLSKPMALVEINEGKVNRLNFNLTCNDRWARGTVQLLYEGLKVKLLKKENHQNEYDVKKMASFLANVSILDANPMKNKPVKVVTVSYNRNIYRSIFSLMWKSIFDGVKKTVGMEES